MRKADELTNPQSCLNRAQSHEWVFVLLARDAAAPVAIRAWVEERIRIGKNTPYDPQIVEAIACATAMEEQAKASDVTLFQCKLDKSKCEHDWNNEGANPTHCLKCGQSFTAFAFMEAP